MQQVQRAANAPSDPSGQDRMVASKAAAIASKARQEIALEKASESEELKTEVAKGTPIINPVSREEEQYDVNKDGVQSLLASVKEFEIQNLIPAA